MARQPHDVSRNAADSGPAPWWFAGSFVLVGVAIWAVGAGMIEVEPERIHAPMWMIQMLGVLFALGGLMAGLKGRVTDPILQGLTTVFLAMFAAIWSWVAFGPGERQFGGGVSLGPVGIGTGGSGGRIAFGVAAVILWLAALAVARSLFRRR